MASWNILPADAGQAEREARAAFFLAHATMPTLRLGMRISDAGWEKIIDAAIQIAGSGDNEAARQIRERLEGMREGSGSAT